MLTKLPIKQCLSRIQATEHPNNYNTNDKMRRFLILASNSALFISDEQQRYIRQEKLKFMEMHTCTFPHIVHHVYVVVKK